MTKELQIGDKIAVKHKGKAVRILTVDRVTKTQAIAGNRKFKREYLGDLLREVPNQIWNTYTCSIAKKEDLDTYSDFRILKKCKELIAENEISKLSKETQLQIIRELQ